MVMQAKPRRGIPQEELDKLQKLREKLADLKVVSTKDGDDGTKEETKKVKVGELNMIDVAANLTNFRYVNINSLVVISSL